MIHRHQLINEAEALGQIGEFFDRADYCDVAFMRDILTKWTERVMGRGGSDLQSCAIAVLIDDYGEKGELREHALMTLVERCLEASTATIRMMARTLPARSGNGGRLHSSVSCKARHEYAVAVDVFLDDFWPVGGFSIIPIDRSAQSEAEPEPQVAAEPAKPAQRKSAKPAPKAKAVPRAKTPKAKKATKPAAKRAPRKSKAA